MVNETTIGAQGMIIAGDLNLSGCDWANQTSTNTYEQSLLDKLSENCFVNFLHPLDSKLDVILTNHPELSLKSYVDRRLTKAYQIRDKSCSDHSAFGTNLEAHKQTQKDLSGMLLAFNKVDWAKFNEDFLSTLFSPYCYSQVNCLLYQWYNWIKEKIERLVPRVTKHRASLKPWISRETSHKIKKLNSLKRKLVTPNLSQLLKIKKFEKEIIKSADNDLKIFEAKIFQTRCFSHIQKYLASIGKNPLIPTRVVSGDQSAETDQGRSELYNNYFVSVFNEGHSTTETCFPKSELNTLKISKNSNEIVLSSLKENKARGHDAIGNLILKNCAKSLSSSLKLVFQTCCNKGTYPEEWKISTVTPVFKDGDKTDVSCYRPISVLCSISKVFEKLIFDSLYLFVKDNLHYSQFGFRKH